MKVFDNNTVIPKYYDNHKNTHTLLVILFSFVVAPILSIVMFAFSGINLVTTSISKIGWQNNLLPVVYIWGLYNLVLFGYLLKLNMDTGKYSKRSRTFFYALTILSCAIILVGISVPFINDDTHIHFVMRKIHNVFATVGFVMFVVVLIALTVTAFFRNKLHALIISGLMAFLIITGIFAVVCVNSPEKATFITAAVQMYIFAMLHVILAANYFLIKFLPNEKFAQTADTPTVSLDRQ